MINNYGSTKFKFAGKLSSAIIAWWANEAIQMKTGSLGLVRDSPLVQLEFLISCEINVYAVFL